MKHRPSNSFSKNLRSLVVGLMLPCLVLAALSVTRLTAAGGSEKGAQAANQSLSPVEDPNFPKEFDVRAIHGTPRETNLTDDPTATAPVPTKVQLRAADRLRNLLGVLNTDKLQIRYNGLTATPRHIFNRNGYLSEPSNLPAETIALNFIRQNRSLFRFSENDLNNFKLTSRAVTETGTTILVFNQQINGKSVYRGDVMVNVAKNGQIINVGGDSYPNLTVANSVAISASQAIQNAAAALGVNNFSPQSLGNTQVLVTYGNLPHEFTTGEKFSRGAFGDDITVTQVLFPMGATARHAYKFTLTTPQYSGIMWQHFVDAQTGATLRRHSLTAFQHLGPPGGGVGVGRRGTFRPDVQNHVEAMNNAGTAQGKTIDGLPTMLAGFNGFGRSTREGTSPDNYIYKAPTYAADTGILLSTEGRGFRYGQMQGRIEFTLPWNNDPVRPTFTHAQLPGLMGQITRGFPDAANPSSGSPFGWFYLPTDTGGAEVTTGNSNRSTTRALGYNMHASAVTKNKAFEGNSPVGDGTQPFSADLTPLGTNVLLPDGRNLSSVFQSRYTEGNNVLTADDRANDNETTHGIKGYSANRHFTAPYYDYYASYEYGGVNAATGVFPASTDPDVPPAAVALFYYNNVLHDYLYEIGFTEQFWNFQMDNFGKGGAGGDYVSTQVMDGSGINNANMGTPDEGGVPRMQMFLFTEAQRRSDGDFDFDVVAHELYHGVSNRSAGKGGTGCLGITLVGESGGMGEGWGDFIAASMTDDDVAGDFVTGNLDRGIRRLPMTNYRWSYGAVDSRKMTVRRNNPETATTPDAQNPTSQTNPFAVHPIGELWSSTLWDMRELLIMKQKVNGTFPGVFFDGNRRLGDGASFFVGERQLKSVDAFHPINFRQEFNSTSPATAPNTLPVPNILNDHFVRPGLVAQENAANPDRNGPLATAVANAARLTDRLVLRGLQLTPCNPSFVEMRDAILAADREITGGENQAIIWRAFASHGIGKDARSTGGTGGTDLAGGAQSAPTVVENFDVPVEVEECETAGPLPAPTFTLANNAPNSVTITITAQEGASEYVIARSTNANGPFTTVATVPSNQTIYTDTDNGDNLTLEKGKTYYYQVRTARNSLCVGEASVNNVTINNGNPPNPAPAFSGVASVVDPRENNKLVLNWSPATSLNPNANIVYDIYRVTSITTANGQNDSTTAPTFTPSETNRIAEGITQTSYTDTNLTLGQVYYYIVQARDTNNSKKDTFNAGNKAAKFSAPTSNAVVTTPFAVENFENASANNRFAPPLVDEPTPNNDSPAWQRVTGAQMLADQPDQLLAQTAAMFAPNIDVAPVIGGGESDFSAIVGPLTNLSETSVLEFDSRFVTEFAFDGGVMEVSLGAPNANLHVYPDNVTTFDLNYFIIENGYLGKLDGTLAGPVMLSRLQGRYAFTGTRDTKRVRVALGSFAPGKQLNPNNQPVYLRFRMTADVGTSPGAGSGWYVDNLVINNYSPSLDIAGVVRYGTNLQKLVPNVSVAATRGSTTVSDLTDSSGAYLLTGLAAGEDYTVTPTKSGDRSGITAFDATLVLRHVAANGQGGNALNANQRTAADSDGDNVVTAFDATQILRYVAANGQNSGTGTVGNWKFDPTNRPYPDLAVSFQSEDYTAFLMGDIDGDWVASASGLAESGQSLGEQSLHSKKTKIGADPDGAALQVSLPTDISAATGDTVEIPVMLANSGKARISSFAIDVEFDPKVLRPDSANPVDTSGTLMENGFAVLADTITARNRIGIAAASGAALVEDSGALIKLRFKVVGKPSRTLNSTSLTQTRLMFADADGGQMAAAAGNGSFVIGNAAPAGKRQ
ncbi:MAG: M36 family metallopeptidase [Acidobacteriota bacterium]|nr:M36 family metallopeptidase [Acidobacteriota bacterium]